MQTGDACRFASACSGKATPHNWHSHEYAQFTVLVRGSDPLAAGSMAMATHVAATAGAGSGSPSMRPPAMAAAGAGGSPPREKVYLTEPSLRMDSITGPGADEMDDLDALKAAVAGTNMESQATLMLRKRKDMRMVEEALEAVKSEYRDRMTRLADRQGRFEEKQRALQEMVTKFKPFIEEVRSGRQQQCTRLVLFWQASSRAVRRWALLCHPAWALAPPLLPPQPPPPPPPSACRTTPRRRGRVPKSRRKLLQLRGWTSK